MKTKNLLIAIFLFTAIALAGCQSSGIVKISPHTYILSKSSIAGPFTNMSKLKAEAIQEATSFAESKDKIAVPVSLYEVRAKNRFPSIDYQFIVVSKNN
jgi:hypothetical protein